MSYLLVAVTALPLFAGLVAVLAGPRRSALAGRVSTALTAMAFGAAVVVGVVVAFDGPVSAVFERADGRALAGLFADRVGVVLLVLVCGVSTVTQAFAQRYLHGDPRATRFFALTGLLTAATAAMVTSATLIGLALGWTVAGVALCSLLALYTGVPAAGEGVRRTVRAFAIGDVALWLAVAIATVTWGSLDLRRLPTQAPELATDATALTLVACLLVVAALARSAQLPLQRWLPATLAAPTPVSALLHAGVVNAGGVLLVRLSTLFGASAAATHLAFVAGAATAVYGTALMLTKPDVKGALAHSTMGQMGFMIMTCGLGAFAAAIFHLVAHGMYKATLFLGSGAAVHRHVRHVKAPPARALSSGERAIAIAFAVVVPALALVAAVALMYADAGGQTGSGGLLAFAWASGAWASWGWLRHQVTVGGLVTALVAVVGAAFVYVGALGAVTAFLAPALSGVGGATVAPSLIGILIAALMLATLVRLVPGRARLEGLHKTLYVLTLSAGHVAGRRPWRPRRPPLGRTLGEVRPGALAPRSAGARS